MQYSTDNGPHMNTWPDGGMTPFRCEKNTIWEGAYRVPCDGAVPGQDKGRLGVERASSSHLDWLPTILAIAGETDIKDKFKKGHKVGGKTFKVHLDGLQPAPIPDGQARRESTHGLYLLHRRW